MSELDKCRQIIDTESGRVLLYRDEVEEVLRADDAISRKAAVDAVTFGITYAKAIDRATGEAKELFAKENEELRKAVERIERLPSVQPEPQWIPCSERMPEEGSWAIWCSNKGSIQVARWKIDAWDHFYPDQGFFELEDAVAWMPLPEPYKERREE